jgi:NAD(P)-dependent dehydrogenase (short-subunit alcohol dehydrogenase family)
VLNENHCTLVVTGGSRGIGAAVARLAGSRGYSVAVNFRGDQAAASSVVEEIRSSGGTAVAIRADVGSEADIIHLFQQAEQELGPICGLVNNAGVTGGISRLETLDAASLTQVLTANIAGTILCAREAVKRMSTRYGGRGGVIVNISSLAARTGGAGEWVHYAASKGAVNTFTIGLAREVAAEGIRVNAVAPGLIATELHAANGVPDRLERLSPTIPILRPGLPAEVAEGVLWLLSDAASYTTGAILEIGGGR